MDNRLIMHKHIIIELGCPNCGGGIPSPSGAYLIYREDWRKFGPHITCPECGAIHTTPPDPWAEGREQAIPLIAA